jgi:hypothetical protein
MLQTTNIQYNEMPKYITKLDTVRAFTMLIKTKIELEKLKLLNKNNDIESIESENAFFNELLNAKIRYERINQENTDIDIEKDNINLNTED